MFDYISLNLKVQQRIALFVLSGKKRTVFTKDNNITGSTAVNLRGNPTVL